MRKSASLFLTFLLPLAAYSATPSVPSIEAMAAYPAMASFSISPDGKHLAALEARGEDRVVLVWDATNLAAPPTTIGTQKMKFQQVVFLKNDTLLVLLWQPIDAHTDKTVKTFTSKIFLTDLQGRLWREPLQQGISRSEVDDVERALTAPTVLDPLVNDPTHALLVLNTGVSQGDVFRVDVASGRAERIQRAEEHVAGYVTDLEGELRSRTEIDSDSGGSFISIEFRNPDGGSWERHFRALVKDRDIIEVVGFGRDPNIAYLRTNVGRDKAVIQEYNVRERRLGEVVFENKFFDASGMRIHHVRDAQFGEIDAFEYFGPTGSDQFFVAPWLQTLDRQVSAAFQIKDTPQQVIDTATGKTATADMRTGRRWYLVSSSLDRASQVIEVEAPNETPVYYLLRDGKMNMLSRTWPQVDPAALGTSRLVYYKARDGLDIPAYLHTPSTALCGPGPWPAVLLPHGGPWARDDLDFDRFMWVPMLNTRCRAVLQPQYRGSSDWGRHLWVAGDAEWGQKMQDDKDDGARWLIEQRVAIPGRIALFGFSYGGYAAFAASIRPNGLYKCAIAGAGVADIKKIWARFYENAYFRDNQESSIRGLNPVDHASEVSIPIYVFSGDRDQTVPIHQSEMFVAKAKSGSKLVTYREFKDFAHGPSWTRANYAEVLRSIDDYLSKGCAGGL
jgi:pimeloyl-ACP methyl ester carboxylesterase